MCIVNDLCAGMDVSDNENSNTLLYKVVDSPRPLMKTAVMK